MSSTKISPGLRAHLLAQGFDPADVAPYMIYNRADAPAAPADVPIPKTSEELAELFGDPGRLRALMASKEALHGFVKAYGEQQQGDGTDLKRLVAEESQRVLANLLKEGGQDDDAIKRLNVDPQSRPHGMLSQHKQGTAYNPKAAGAIIDKEFTSLVDYAYKSWHLNEHRDPATYAKMMQIQNAASSVVPADGGFLVPETLRAQLLQVALEMAVVRPRATVVPMETARVPIPMIDVTTNATSVFGGMIAYWGEESAALTDANPKFGRAVLDAKKLTGLSVVPNELLADSLISFSALIEQLWPMALAWYEDAAFMVGTGVGEPLGFLGNSATVAVTKETGQAANTLFLENIVKMYSRMLPASLARGIWTCSPDSLPELFTMALNVGTGGGPVMLTNAAGPAPVTIMGRPLVVTEKAKTLGTQGDLAFVDLTYYLIGDRQVMTASSSTDYKFGNDQTAYRIIQRVDGTPWIKSAITPQNGSPNTLSPFVEIETRA